LNIALGWAASCWPLHEEKLVEMYRLFLGTPGFDADLEDTSLRYTWLEECINTHCFDLILEYEFPRFAFLPVETRFELVIRADTINPNMKVSRFLKYIGLLQSDTKLASLRSSTGTSILHHIAHRIKYFHLEGQPNELKEWYDLGVNVLKNGADPSYTAQLTQTRLIGPAHTILYSERKSRERSPATPLIDAIGHMWWKGGSKYAFVRTLKIIRVWVEMLQLAGIDLIEYGGKESQIWRSLSLQDHRGFERPWHSDDDISCKVEQLVYGSTPTDWSLIFSREWRVPILELKPPPGTFPEEHHLPTTIIWHPTREEDNEGHWEVQTKMKIFSDPMDLRDVVEAEEPFTELIRSTQDDSSVIMLMNFQSARPQNWASRSSSQPPSIRGRRGEPEYTPFGRLWLQNCHFCCFDWRWRLCCVGNICERAYNSRLFTGPYMKDCINGTSNKANFSIQNSMMWFDYSYLAEIARCQDGDKDTGHIKSQRTWKWRPKILRHSGNRDCPQGCWKVDLNRLQVPEYLQEYHPRRKHDG
jgi:hypothetical protein